MQNQPTDEQKEMRLYHLRKRGWVYITLWVLCSLLAMWLIALFVYPFLAWILFFLLIWVVLEDLHVFPYTTVAIAISKERIALQQKNGKEKNIMTKVTEIKERRARIIVVRGLDPNGKKTSISVSRGNLGREQYEDLRKYLEQFFPTGN